MKFLVELPTALAQWLVAHGSDAIHVLDCGLADASDRMIWARACDEARIVVSKDGDFALLASRTADAGRLLWVRVGNCRREALLARFEAIWPAIQDAFANGERIVELR